MFILALFVEIVQLMTLRMTVMYPN